MQKDFSPKKTVLLIGNPNVGKSLIFNHLTGRYANVSNYPGTTVEISKGFMKKRDESIKIIDTPGIKTLFASTDDERVTRDIILKESPEFVILVVDSKNLKRGLLILFQLKLLNIKTILVLNMWDEAVEKGIRIDVKKLEEILRIPVIPTIAIHNKGIKELINSFDKAKVSEVEVKLNEKIEKFIDRIEKVTKKNNITRGIIYLFLSNDEFIEIYMRNVLGKEFSKILKLKRELEKKFTEPLEIVLISELNKLAEQITNKVKTVESHTKQSKIHQYIDYFITHPILGYVFIGVVLYFLHLFVGILGAGIFVDFLENKVFGEFINPFITKSFKTIPLPGLIESFFVGEYGVFTMALTYGFAIIFPVVLTFFIAFGILEDSGYFPRLSMLLDKTFKIMGLTGKAVLPMVLGLGCDTMATVTTRTLDTKKEKIIVTLLLALGVPCSAQMGVILALVSGFSFYAFIVWAVVIILNLIIVGFLSSKILKGEESYFILEIPPLRIPSMKNILWKTIARIEWYLKEVIPVFIIGTAILFFMDITGILSVLTEIFKPVVVKVLGLPSEAAIGFIMGFLRRDYGAAGFFMLKENGVLDVNQVVVSIVTITLFVPCIANFLVIIKERGVKTAIAISTFIVPYAVFVGFIVKLFLQKFPIP